MRRHLKRWGIELGLLVLALGIGLAIDSSRTCTTPEFGLPMTCDPLYTSAALLLLYPLVVFEIGFAIRRRTATRPCPRCGNRVRRGTLDCGSCDFDFRTI